MGKRRERCPYCKGTHIWRVGYILSPHRGKRLRVKCQNEHCAHTWFSGEKPKSMQKGRK